MPNDPLTQPAPDLAMSLPHMLEHDRGAWFTDDGRHRLSLWRWWDRGQKPALFLGLNPSRADATRDDPTIYRMKRFARDHGYGGLYVANLYTLVTPYPTELLRRLGEAVAVGADAWLLYMANRCPAIIACWGATRWATPRGQHVLTLLNRSIMCLGVNADHSPRHPLYLPKDTVPTLYWRPAPAPGDPV